MSTRRSRRVLAIGLDGYEPSLGDELMAAGELPALARLRERSARFTLDHGPAQRTGSRGSTSPRVFPRRREALVGCRFRP
jgi:hypothetical protein